MKYSAGIIPFRMNNGNMEFFVGHPGGVVWKYKQYWAFLKGHVENGEDWCDTAIREFEEESGLKLNENEIKSLIPLGTTLQNPNKTVIAYGLNLSDIDPLKCHSNMADNGLNPEIDKYRWMPYDEIKKFTHHMHLIFYDKLLKLNDEYNK